jgi:hypothetical protein
MLSKRTRSLAGTPGQLRVSDVSTAVSYLSVGRSSSPVSRNSGDLLARFFAKCPGCVELTKRTTCDGSLRRASGVRTPARSLRTTRLEDWLAELAWLHTEPNLLPAFLRVAEDHSFDGGTDWRVELRRHAPRIQEVNNLNKPQSHWVPQINEDAEGMMLTHDSQNPRAHGKPLFRFLPHRRHQTGNGNYSSAVSPVEGTPRQAAGSYSVKVFVGRFRLSVKLVLPTQGPGVRRQGSLCRTRRYSRTGPAFRAFEARAPPGGLGDIRANPGCEPGLPTAT